MEDIDRWRAIGADIRRRREQLGMNQSALGRLAGDWKQGVVSDDERGPRNGIPPSRLVAYSDVLADTAQDDEALLDVWLRMAYYDGHDETADGDGEALQRHA